MYKTNSKSASLPSRAGLQRKQIKVLDESTRNRRNRQQLEQLERDNHHDDPHANLVMHKKAPKFEDNNVNNNPSTSSANSTKRYNIPRSRLLSLNVLIEENSRTPAPNYMTILTRSLSKRHSNITPNVYLPNIEIPSIKRHFCSVCGFKGDYTCIVCGLRYCSSNCHQIHAETRCLKWTS